MLTVRRSLQVMVGPLAKSCYAAVSDPGASRRASHQKHTIPAIVDIRFLARLNVQAIRNTTLDSHNINQPTRNDNDFLNSLATGEFLHRHIIQSFLFQHCFFYILVYFDSGAQFTIYL